MELEYMKLKPKSSKNKRYAIAPQRKDIIKQLFSYQEHSHDKFDIKEGRKWGQLSQSPIHY
jgi:hypothetical protein